MLLSRRSLAARYGPSAGSIRDIELNYRPEKFRVRTLHQLDRSLGWTPGTALRLATGDPQLTDDEFTQLVDDSQAAPTHVPDPLPIAVPEDIADTSDTDSKDVPLDSDTSDDTSLNDEPLLPGDNHPLDATLYKAFGQLRATVSQIKADMTLRSIADDSRDQRDINQRIVQGMNELEALTAELQDSVYPPMDPDAIPNTVIEVLNQDRSSPGPGSGPAVEAKVCV